ncbi:MAG TPA: tetratricopeptide repeat protein, partial [Lacipirellulaceae bacterium]|nr:tetratricopeptide repeat protein [Lacipirellulaceae bacterium]
SVHVVGWPACFPAESVRGSMVCSQFVAPTTNGDAAAASGACYPPALEDSLRPLVTAPHNLSAEQLAPFEAAAPNADDRAAIAGAVAYASSIQSIACRLAAEQSWDLLAVWLPTLAAWGGGLSADDGAEQRRGERSEAATRRAIFSAAAWQLQDQMLASLVAAGGDRVAIVLVAPVAAGARGAIDPSAPPERPRLGIACLAGPGIRPNATLYGGTVLDVTPTVLACLGTAVGDDMDGRPWVEAFDRPVRLARKATWEPADGAFRAPIAEECQLDDPRGPVARGQQPDATEMLRAMARNHKVNLALALADSNRTSAAIAAWQALVEEFPEDPAYRGRLIASLLQGDRPDDCQRVIDDSPPALQQLPQMQLAQAEIALSQGRRDDALRIAREQTAALDDARLLSRAGQIMLQCGAWSDAEAAFRAAVHSCPHDPLARDGLSVALWEQDRFEDALREAQRALDIVPCLAAAQFHVGRCLHSLGRDDEGIAALEACLAQDDALREAHYHLAILYCIRDPQRARRHRLQAGMA